MRTIEKYLANKRGILALLVVLALMAMLATQAVWAQDEEDDPCTEDGVVIRCAYAENDTEPVVRIYATSPERDEVEFSLEGVDAADFTINGGVLRFKKSPSYEQPTDRVRAEVTAEEDNPETDADETVKAVTAEEAMDNEYHVTVRSTDVRPEGAKGASPSSTVDVIVSVSNEDEDGTVDISWRQPEVTTQLTAVASDPDVISGTTTYEWSIPKVSRPTLTNDSHWQNPAGSNNSDTYTPLVGDEGNYLRVKAEYTDGEGGSKVAYVRSEFRVRESVEDDSNEPPSFDEGLTDTRKIPENADVGDAVGNPVVADDTDGDDKGRLTYTIDPDSADARSFSIHKATGQIRVAGELDHEDGSLTGIPGGTASDGIYVITVMVTDPTGASDSPKGEDTIDVTITATDVDEAPSVKGANTTDDPVTTHTIAEGGSLIDEGDLPNADNNPFSYQAVATDDPAVEVVSLLLNGDDAAAFKLVDLDGTGGDVVYGLAFEEAPNFESPTDANKDNAYKVKVVARDDAGNRSGTDVTVTVTNSEEEGEVTLSSIQPAVGTELTAMVSDPDGGVTNVSWQWQSAPTAAGSWDDIDDATSATYTPTAGDPADKDDTGDIGNYLRVAVVYNDAQAPDDKSSKNVIEGQRELDAISKNAVRELPETNSAPVFTERSVTREVPENTPAGDSVGDPVKATDADEDLLSYTLSGGADKGAFEVDLGTGQIEVGADTKLNFEGDQKTYTVVVKAEDPFALSDTITVTIIVTNVTKGWYLR